jgi:hypothetical protein
MCFKSNLYYDRQSVLQSVLVSCTHLGRATNFSHSRFDYFLDSCGFVDVGRPLWQEVGSVVLNFCQASPAQPFSDLSPTEVEVQLWPTVSRPVHLGVRHLSGTRDQFFFLLEIFFRQLRVCYFVATSLMRGNICNLLLLLVLASAVLLGSESRGTEDHILLPQFLRLPQPGGPGPHIYIPQERVARIYPRELGSLSVAPYKSQGYSGGILSCLKSKSKSKLHYNWRSVSMSWCLAQSGTIDQSLLSHWNFF